MPIVRLPLSQPIESRTASFAKDSRCVNGYFETRDQSKREFIKRPGLLQVPVDPALPAMEAQGLAAFNGYLYAVVDNTLTKIDPTTFVSSTAGTITGTVANCSFVNTLNNAYMFMHNKTNGYLLNGSSGAFTQITNDKVAVVNILTGGSGYVSPTVTFSAPPSGTTATGTVQVTGGVVTGVTITNPGSGYVTAPTVTINPVGGGSGASASSLLNFFPTGPLVPGAVFLDQYVIVATESGRLYSSNVGNPTIWNPLDYLTAEAEPDNMVGITKHFNYVIGFGEWSTEFFYDAANLTGSPLAPAPAYRMEIGCANGDSIVQFEQSVIWIGKSKSEGAQVFMMEGTSPIKVSTVYIDRWLKASNLEDVKGYVFKMNGHTFYVMTLHDLNVTLVYDVSEKMWYQWTMWATDGGTTYAEQYFRPSYYVGLNSTYWALDDDTGVLYKMSSDYYNDAGAPIYYRCVTDITDSGTTKRKFISRLEIIGDKIGGTMKIRHSDDDYQTWSTYRSVDLSKPRPQIYQLGQSRRRSWEFLCTDSVPLRLDAAEIDFNIGEMEQDAAAPTPYRR